MKTDDQRKEWQRTMREWGYYTGAIDGGLGPLCDKAYQGLKTATDAVSAPLSTHPGTFHPFLTRLIVLANSEIGTKEAGTNNGKRVNEYQSADWIEGGGYAWCASFICWLIREALKSQSMPFDRPETAGAWDFERWAKTQEDNGVTLIKPTGHIRAGDIVIFTFSHIGLAVTNENGGMVTTVEGNTNGVGSREGDGVYRKSRSKSSIRSVVRLV